MEFRKDRLRKLKRIYATPSMMRKARNDVVHKMYCRCQSRGGILMVCFFDIEMMKKGWKEPLYELYINPASDQWLTWIQPKGQQGKWSTAMVSNLGKIADNWYRYYGNSRQNLIWQNSEGKREIKSYLQTEASGWMGILEWQQTRRQEKIRKAEEREQAQWDEDMSLIGKDNKAFRKWMTKEVVREWFIFYESTKGGAKKGYCTHCQKNVALKSKPVNNKAGFCPVCRKDIKYKVSGRIGGTETKWYHARIMEQIKGGIVERFYEEQHYYSQKDGYRNPRIYNKEYKRILIMDDGTLKAYSWSLYKNKKIRWVENKSYTFSGNYYRYLSIPMYKRNLKQIQKKTARSSYWCWDGMNIALNIALGDYLWIEKKKPALELTAKVGLMKIAKDILENDWKTDQIINMQGNDLQTVLGIDKARIKRLKQMDGNIDMVRWLQIEKMADTIWPDEMIRDFSSLRTYRQSNMFGFLKPPYNYQKLWRYAKRQQELTGLDFDAVITEWDDYISMAGTMKMDISKEQIWKPKNVKKAHDNLIRLKEKDGVDKMVKDLQKKWPKVEKNLKNLKKYEYAESEYVVIAPKDIRDIVWEGVLLNHCIHTCDFYFERTSNRETYLFFLRRAETPDVPWYTLEVEQTGNIRQKRTVGDNQNEDLNAAIPFLQRFQRHFVEKMTKEEKELGKKADKKRREEYKQLRDKGNKVWHGKLAGQLLADVLEKDFMEVC